MKRIIPLVLSFLLIFSSAAFAEDGQAVDAGITPSSILYSFDKFVEDLQLLVTTDGEKETQLLLEFAQERLSEAKEMTEEQKTEFVQTAMVDYLELINKANETISEIHISDDVSDEVKEELQTELEETLEIDEEITENLGEEQLEELEVTKEVVISSARVVKGIGEDIIKSLRGQDFGYGQIAQIALLAEKSGKTVEEVSSLFSGEEKGFGEVAKELGFSPSQLKKSEKAKSQEASKPNETSVQPEISKDAATALTSQEPQAILAKPETILKPEASKVKVEEKKPVEVKSQNTEKTPNYSDNKESANPNKIEKGKPEEKSKGKNK